MGTEKQKRKAKELRKRRKSRRQRTHKEMTKRKTELAAGGRNKTRKSHNTR